MEDYILMDIYTSAPAVTDDGTKGYKIGDEWYDSAAGVKYIAKSVATGAAVWDAFLVGLPELKSCFTWVVSAPAIGGIPGPNIPHNFTITKIIADVTTATSVAFNIEKRSAANTAGTNCMSSEFTATTTRSSSSTFSSANGNADDELFLDISNVTGAVETLRITIYVQRR